jgi:hypothetical protein
MGSLQQVPAAVRSLDMYCKKRGFLGMGQIAPRSSNLYLGRFFN